MGYAKIIQYGDITEVYNYEKDLVHTPKRPLSALQKKRAKEARLARRTRRISSLRRSRNSFFRLVHHNSVLADRINFLTLTFPYDIDKKEAQKAQARFFQRLTESIRLVDGQVSLSYISVPERTKRGWLHYHILVYNLPPYYGSSTKEDPTICIERKTRNLQRLFGKGFLDLGITTHVTEGLAGYMAKYMAKNLENGGLKAGRGYSASHNIKKVGSFGGNSLFEYPDYWVGDKLANKWKTFDTLWLGQCNYYKYK